MGGGKKNRGNGSKKKEARKEKLRQDAQNDAAMKATIASAMFEAGSKEPRAIVAARIQPMATYKKNGLDVSIEFCAPGTEAFQKDPAFIQKLLDINEANMKSVYDEASGEGWNRRAKEREMTDEAARFFVAYDVATRQIKGYVHVRFLIEGNCCVAYVYDVQIAAESQRCGLGRWLCTMVELSSRKLNLDWCMLTVFNANKRALNFFPKKLKYTVDETSPQFTAYGDDEDSPYVILSKNLKPHLQKQERKIVQ